MPLVVVREGNKRLAHGRGVQHSKMPRIARDPEHLGTVHLVDREVVVAIPDREDGGLAGPLRHALQDGPRGTRKAVVIGYPLAELEDAKSQVVAAAVGLVVDESVAGQGSEQPVGGTEGQLRLAGELRGAGPLRLIAQQYEEAQGLADHVGFCVFLHIHN